MNWDEYFFELVKAVSQKSKDRSTKVGAVIVGPDRGIRSTGFNGFPVGVNDNDDLDTRHERPLKYFYTEHAERNAIFIAARHVLAGCSIYLDFFPCADCARGIIQAGLVEVVIDARNFDEKKYWDSRWKESCDIALKMLEEAGVRVRLAGSTTPISSSQRL
jgi:dCMP deaminase